MQSGQVLAGRYRLLSLKSAGGMGEVWRAEHVALRSPVAVKLLAESHVGDDQAIARFVREAQAAAWLRSPHVVQILDCGSDGGVPFIVMELLDGETLSERIQRYRRLGPVETALVITHVARALGKAHEAGVVHRDLKPENVFLVRNDEEMIAKVFDFGVAKVVEGDAAPLTCAGALLGTPAYMSPEQIYGAPVDHRTDVWALGVIAFECLLGRRVFPAQDREQVVMEVCTRPMPIPSQVGSVPPGFDAWFATATARERAQRFRTAREAAARVREVCGAANIGPFIHAWSDDEPSEAGAVASDFRATGAALESFALPEPERNVLCAVRDLPAADDSPVCSGRAPRAGERPESRRRSPPIVVEPPSPRASTGGWGPALAVATGIALLLLAALLALTRR